MTQIRYFFEYIFIIIVFGLSKLLGYKISSEVGYLLGKTFGLFFRSAKLHTLELKAMFLKGEAKR